MEPLKHQMPVVLRYRGGKTERVTIDAIEAIDGERAVLTAAREDGTVHDVAFSELKAVFFVRTEPEEALPSPAGSVLSIEFIDGEVIRGIAQYNPERNGFFLYPLDRSRNDRIFVLNSAIVSIEVEKL